MGRLQGVSIHSEHPFLPPAEDQDAVRRLRGRLAATVTLWTSGEGAARAGLTVTSLLVAGGEPGRILALIDPDSDLLDAVRERGRFVVSVLGPAQRGLADAFSGTAPAPGGGFAQAEFVQTAWGPRPAASGTWAGCRLDGEVAVGWSALLTGSVEQVQLDETAPLVHLRGRYGHWTPGLPGVQGGGPLR